MNSNDIREYNKRLNGLKSNVQKLEMQIEMQEKMLNEKLGQISELVGEQVTAENVEAYYQKISSELENQLTNGLAILDSISGNSGATANNYMQTPTQPQTQAGVQNQQFGGFNQPTQPQVQTPVQPQVQQNGNMLNSGLAGFAQQFNGGTPTNNGQTNNAGQTSVFGSSMSSFGQQPGINMNILGV